MFYVTHEDMSHASTAGQIIQAKILAFPDGAHDETQVCDGL
ncbi:hypothetical protein ANDA3_3588 [plant metagenome]|uniref:Uncharacterized protein n=2 Tax=root TaxID=1 RepID=A0A1C3JWM4_9BURK|nr:hypothetical protein ODI_00093 [Orrella dioscoreae]SOE51621.1 hypothetical protein ODI_R3572 [Orrella dioscoreae]